jgi:DHA1 family bicyclomycin/chloramphenicol resistance-like MFS transporter
MVLLVAMTGIGPFTMQILIPSLPALAEALASSYGLAQLTLTLFLAGVAGAQLVYGPLSDRYGRKPLLLAGWCSTASAASARRWRPPSMR